MSGHAHGSAAPSLLWVVHADSGRDLPGFQPLEGGLAWEQAESEVGTAGGVSGFTLERAEAGCAVQGQEMDSIVLVGPFQRREFHDSVLELGCWEL